MYHDILPTDDAPRNSEGDTLCLSDGRLLLAWTRFEGREDHARAEVCAVECVVAHASVRASSGPPWDLQEWGAQRVLVSAAEARQNVMSVSLLRERASGDVLLFYLRKHSYADLQVYVRRSRDEGASWGAAQPVSAQHGYHVMNNARVLQTAEGRLLAPVAHVPDFGVSHHQVAFCCLSDDGGHTWRQGRGTVALPQSQVGCQEPAMVQLPSGRVLMGIRTDLDCVYAAYSDDGGETWDSPAPLRALPSPASPCTLAVLPDGGLVALYNHRPDGARAGWTGRTPLSASRSDDGGRTWGRLPDIETSTDAAYAYTSLRVWGDWAVLSYYVWPRNRPGLASFDRTALRVRVLPLAMLGVTDRQAGQKGRPYTAVM